MTPRRKAAPHGLGIRPQPGLDYDRAMQGRKAHGTRCSHVPTCELFPKFALRGSLRVWQTFYCEGDFSRCARYELALAGKPVLPNLLPNGKTLDLQALGVSP